MDLVADMGSSVVGQVGGGLGDAVAKFAASAAAGGFAVSPAGGQALLNLIDEFKHWTLGVQRHLVRISEQPPLGRLAGGTTMAPFMVEVATDPNGFITRFQELRDSLVKVQEAISRAMANYQATETENEQLLGRIGGHI